MSMKFLSCTDTYFTFETKGVTCRLSFTGNKGWRLQSADKNGAFDDFGAGQVLARDLGETPYLHLEPITLRQNGEDAFILTAKDGSRVEITGTPFLMQFYTANNAKSARIDKIIVVWDTTVTLRGKLEPRERVYGTGQHFDRVNQRGHNVIISATDQWAQWKGNSYCPIPMFLSDHGYGLFMNRYEFIEADLDTRGDGYWDLCLKQGAPIDLYVFVGTLADALYGYSAISGFAPEPAGWLYGTQICRYYPDFSTTDGVREQVRHYEENGFPYDAVIMESFDTYDKDKTADLAKLIAEMNAKGKRIMMYQACGVPPTDEKNGFRDEYLVHRKVNGSSRIPETNSANPMDNPNGNGSSRQYVDITNPQAWKWWTETVWGPLMKAGVQGCKIDFCELLNDTEDLVFYDGRPSAGAHHWYPTLYNTLMYKLYCTNPDGGMNLSRGGGIGAQRYPFLWAGDQKREWFFLRAVIRSVLTSGLSGLPFMSYDASAYMPTNDPEENPEPDVFIRGIEFTAFSANIQTHGKVTRPYDFEAPIRNLYRIYATIHDRLRPYLTEQGKVSCKTGEIFCRRLALVLWDHTDDVCCDCEDEYMLGDGFLVAPVLENTDRRDVYLPAGRWKDLLTGAEYSGRTTLYGYHAALSRIPVFINLDSTSAALPDVLSAIAPLVEEINAL